MEHWPVDRTLIQCLHCECGFVADEDVPPSSTRFGVAIHGNLDGVPATAVVYGRLGQPLPSCPSLRVDAATQLNLQSCMRQPYPGIMMCYSLSMVSTGDMVVFTERFECSVAEALTKDMFPASELVHGDQLGVLGSQVLGDFGVLLRTMWYDGVHHIEIDPSSLVVVKTEKGQLSIKLLPSPITQRRATPQSKAYVVAAPAGPRGTLSPSELGPQGTVLDSTSASTCIFELAASFLCLLVGGLNADVGPEFLHSVPSFVAHIFKSALQQEQGARLQAPSFGGHFAHNAQNFLWQAEFLTEMGKYCEDHMKHRAPNTLAADLDARRLDDLLGANGVSGLPAGPIIYKLLRWQKPALAPQTEFDLQQLLDRWGNDRSWPPNISRLSLGERLETNPDNWTPCQLLLAVRHALVHWDTRAHWQAAKTALRLGHAPASKETFHKALIKTALSKLAWNVWSVAYPHALNNTLPEELRGFFEAFHKQQIDGRSHKLDAEHSRGEPAVAVDLDLLLAEVKAAMEQQHAAALAQYEAAALPSPAAVQQERVMCCLSSDSDDEAEGGQMQDLQDLPPPPPAAADAAAVAGAGADSTGNEQPADGSVLQGPSGYRPTRSSSSDNGASVPLSQGAAAALAAELAAAEAAAQAAAGDDQSPAGPSSAAAAPQPSAGITTAQARLTPTPEVGSKRLGEAAEQQQQQGQPHKHSSSSWQARQHAASVKAAVRVVPHAPPACCGIGRYLFVWRRLLDGTMLPPSQLQGMVRSPAAFFACLVWAADAAVPLEAQLAQLQTLQEDAVAAPYQGEGVLSAVARGASCYLAVHGVAPNGKVPSRGIKLLFAMYPSPSMYEDLQAGGAVDLFRIWRLRDMPAERAGLLVAKADARVECLLALLAARDTKDSWAQLSIMSSCECPLIWHFFSRGLLSTEPQARQTTLQQLQQGALTQLVQRMLQGGCKEVHPVADLAKLLLFERPARSSSSTLSSTSWASSAVLTKLWLDVEEVLPEVLQDAAGLGEDGSGKDRGCLWGAFKALGVPSIAFEAELSGPRGQVPGKATQRRSAQLSAQLLQGPGLAAWRQQFLAGRTGAK